MSAKLIDTTCFETEEEYQRIVQLASSIKRRHSIIAKEQEEINNEKNEICSISSEIFFNDIEQKAVPEVHGNHEFHIPNDIISVNFRMMSRPMKEINGKPAHIFLKDKFGDEAYDKVFSEEVTHEVNVDQLTLIDQAQRRPELFRIALRPDLDEQQLAQLIIEHPDFVQVQVANTEKYTAAHPGHTTKTIEVKVKRDFLNKVAKLDNIILKRTQNILKAIIRPAAKASVLCGNSTKTISKKK